MIEASVLVATLEKMSDDWGFLRTCPPWRSLFRESQS